MIRRVRHILLSLGAVAAVFSAPVAAQAPSVGSSAASPAVLGRLFTAACLQSPTLSDAQSVLARAGMVPNPETGTYFHQLFDMSVNPSGILCSMVFLGDDPANVAAAFRGSAEPLVGAQVQDIEIRRLDGHADPYFRASVEVSW